MDPAATRLEASPFPALETERLALRVHGLDDFQDSAAMWGDARVTRYIGGKPLGSEEVWARLLRHAGHWTLLRYGFWVIRERSSHRFVGETGFADLRRTVAPALDAPEIGWALAPWAQGKGYATEAVRAALAWGDAHLPGRRTVCLIHPQNAASLRIAGKCGFVARAQTVYRGEPANLYERRA